MFEPVLEGWENFLLCKVEAGKQDVLEDPHAGCR